MATTSVEWTDKVWNPVTGCTKVSQGCKNCYAERIANRFWGDRKFSDVQCHEDRLDDPLKWKKPSRIFVNSMSDLFHEKVPFKFVLEVWVSMLLSRKHTFQILTKRPHIMAEFWNEYLPNNWGSRIARFDLHEPLLPNVWVGVSVEDQPSADERIPLLLQTQAAVRFVSYEPALGAVDFTRIGGDHFGWGRLDALNGLKYIRANPDEVGHGEWEYERKNRLDWVICGGESGPGARPMHPDWARSVRDQCQEAGVPYFFKQHGEWTTEYPQGMSLKHMEQDYIDGVTYYRVGKRAAGRLLDGRTWDEFPNAS